VSVLVEVNTSLVNVINSLVAAGQFMFSTSNYKSWNSVGVKTTDDTIKTLAQLYQRNLQAASLPLNLALPDSKLQRVNVGEWKYPGGARYKGEVVNGKRHGYGTEHSANGEHYEGNWVSNKREGYGKTVYTDGSSYTGERKADQFHGHGYMIWACGASYNGEWWFGQRHGQGVHTYSNGSECRGTWRNGKEWNVVQTPVQCPCRIIYCC